MAMHCPICSKSNPAGATYCHYDGRALTQVSEGESWWAKSQVFPRPFTFPGGQSCVNFDQLAVACDSHWAEAKGFLADGIWCSFFNLIGRQDLATAAAHAAREPDGDIGLANFLERLPTSAVRPPTLSLLSRTEDLGTLRPGEDHRFEVVISNKGGLVLTGQVATDCPWLFFGDRHGDVSRKLFQTRDTYTLVVRVIGTMLRAGHKPVVGEIVVETNGGTLTIAVTGKVPVLPFPGGNVLAGARSPRDVALKAKAHVQEAAPLFEQGAVKAWYSSNGWTYPVQGTQSRGKGAVQQFFEALGLSRPPALEVDTPRIVCRGEAGQRLTESVTISTKESKFVHADAQSDQPWVKVQPGKSQGNRLTIPLIIDVPRTAGQTLQANLVVLGNGQQRFVVPVTLTVVSEETNTGDSVGAWANWVMAGLGVSVLLFLGMGAVLVYQRRAVPVPPPVAGTGEPRPPANTGEPPPPLPPPPAARAEAWWDAIPGQTLAANVALLKGLVEANDRSLFEQIAARSDVDRYGPYGKLAERVPALVRQQKVTGALSEFLTQCCVHEPSDRNLSDVRRALVSLYPEEGSSFRPEDEGSELDRAMFARQVVFNAMTHKAVQPGRARDLAGDLVRVHGPSLDTNAPPPALQAETEKLLAQRFFRNTVLTAAGSPDLALTVRDRLIAQYQRHLPAEFQLKHDADLLVAALAKGEGGRWPKLEPIFKACLASEDRTIGLALVTACETAGPPADAKMEGLLAARWKVAGNPKLTKPERLALLRKTLNTDPEAARREREKRIVQMRERAEKALGAAKPGPQNDLANLTQAARLAHCSTLASILINKDAEVERFDELLSRAPEAKAPFGDGKKPEEKPEEKPKAPAEPGKVIELGGQPHTVSDELTKDDPRDLVRGTFRKTYPVSLRAGQMVTIEMRSNTFNPYVKLEGPTGRQLAVASVKGGAPSARINYTPTGNGVYRVIATTVVKGVEGAFTLQIQQGFGMPGFGPGLPPPRFRRGFPPFFPVAPMFPFMPEQPKEGPKGEAKEDSKVNKSDLAALVSPQRNTRVTAFLNLAGSLPNDLGAPAAEKIARYLLVTVGSDGEYEEVAGKLAGLSGCRHLLAALADVVAGNDKVTQLRTEAVVGTVLGQRLRFARDEDWRSASRKLLLQRALDLTVISAVAASADMTAEYLRDIYKAQGVALGLDGEGFLALAEPAPVLEEVIKHVATRVTKKDLQPADREYLGQVDRHLQAARFAADNDLENVVLLQRIWVKVLCAYLAERAPAQAKGFQKVQLDLTAQDRDSRSLFDQVRLAEEKLLRAWLLAINPTGP